MVRRCWCAVVVSSFFLACPATVPPVVDAGPAVVRLASGPGLQPPRAERRPTSTMVHERQWIDEYAWLEKGDDPAVQAHLRLENAYTDAVTAPMRPLRATLAAELRAHEPAQDESVPVEEHGFRTWHRWAAGQEHGTVLRQRLDGGPEEVLLDLEALGRPTGFADVITFDVTDDGRRLAALVDTVGTGEAALSIEELPGHAHLPIAAERVSDLAWAADGATLFYVTRDDAHRPHRLWRHEVGGKGPDALVYEEKDAHFSVSVSRTRSGAYVVLELASLTTSEARVLDASRPKGAFQVVLPRNPGVRYQLDHRAQSFFLRLNDAGRDFRLVEVPVAAPTKREKWVEWWPASAAVPLEDVEVFRRFVVVQVREGGLPVVRALTARGQPGRAFTPAAAHWTLEGEPTPDFDAQDYRLAWSNPVQPTTTLAWRPDTGATRVLKVEAVPGFDASQYETEWLEVAADDGARVPVSLSWKKGTPRDGTAPMLLDGYGAYGASQDAAFTSQNLPLLDRGVILATAHVRGGGELGPAWHDAGRLAKKPNTFRDFIACAEFLEARKYTSPARLLITGASAGGLLVGAVLNQRPELFKAAFVEVPFVDVLNTMLDEAQPLTVEEYEEWGDPRVEPDFLAMMAWSPVDNVRAQAYPAMLVRASLHDTQVPFHEPVKWVARLRALKTDQSPLLLRMDLGAASHSGASGRFQALDQAAFAQAFLLWQVGVTR